MGLFSSFDTTIFDGGYLSSMPVATHLKNYSAVTFMIVHLEWLLQVTRGNRSVKTTCEMRPIDIPLNKRQIKGLVNLPISLEAEIRFLKQSQMRQ